MRIVWFLVRSFLGGVVSKWVRSGSWQAARYPAADHSLGHLTLRAKPAQLFQINRGRKIEMPKIGPVKQNVIQNPKTACGNRSRGIMERVSEHNRLQAPQIKI